MVLGWQHLLVQPTLICNLSLRRCVIVYVIEPLEAVAAREGVTLRSAVFKRRCEIRGSFAGPLNAAAGHVAVDKDPAFGAGGAAHEAVVAFLMSATFLPTG